MIGHTFLNEEEKKELKKTIQKLKIGESTQDAFLEKLIKQYPLENEEHKFRPSLIYNANKYSANGNWRTIRDGENDLAYAYFDYPSMKSPLYITTFTPMFIYPLIQGIQQANKRKKFRTTPLGLSIATIKIYNGTSHEEKQEEHRTLESKQTLEFFYDEHSELRPERAVQVIDREDIPPNLLETLLNKQ